ncbi:MAG: ribonuclease H-like YkuK family protein [Candidatus Pacebacteria bacterium]|nr:ribonuclease H-like YkuK family protein [Candidatus Paceibacterota bacterium]
MEKLFNSSLGIKLNKDQIVKAINDFINDKPERKYKIIIGSDSLKRPDNKADFVTAIVVHRVGNGGKYFWRHLEMTKIHTLRDRIIQEVLLSLETGKEMLETLHQSGAKNFDFEIHVDVGEKGPTKSLIQEVTGIIRANNFEFKIKPNSYGASKVADRHV